MGILSNEYSLPVVGKEFYIWVKPFGQPDGSAVVSGDGGRKELVLGIRRRYSNRHIVVYGQ